MSCDMRFASEKAAFRPSRNPDRIDSRVGRHPETAPAHRYGRAKEIILGGEQIDAKRAYEVGLVNRIYPADQLMPETMKFARKWLHSPVLP